MINYIDSIIVSNFVIPSEHVIVMLLFCDECMEILLKYCIQHIFHVVSLQMEISLADVAT
jgi:hypothetical protein